MEAQFMESIAAARAEKNGSPARDKRGKFVALAESRTVNAIRAIRVIGKLGNKSHYEYSDTDVKKILSALSKEIDSLKARLTAKGGKTEVEFKL
jgi:ribosomal protein L7/L12